MIRLETLFPALERMPAVAHGLELVGLVSLLTFVVGLVVIPWGILLLPEDFFLHHWERVARRRKRHPVVAVVILTLRNLVGLGCVLAGLVMLVLPGQGLLAIAVGISVADFPGKHRLLDQLVQLQPVQRGLNWIRRRGGRKEFVFK